MVSLVFCLIFKPRWEIQWRDLCRVTTSTGRSIWGHRAARYWGRVGTGLFLNRLLSWHIKLKMTHRNIVYAFNFDGLVGKGYRQACSSQILYLSKSTKITSNIETVTALCCLLGKASLSMNNINFAPHQVVRSCNMCGKWRRRVGVNEEA